MDRAYLSCQKAFGSFAVIYFVKMALSLRYDLRRGVAETMYGDLSEKEIKVLEYIRINEPVTRSDIETLLGIDNKKAVRILNKLIDKGVIISQGKSRGVTYSVSGQFSGRSVSKN